MTPERWRQVNDVFHAALEKDPASRSVFVRTQVGTDEELLREVQTLLENHHKSEGYLDMPAWAVGADLMFDDEPSLVGQTIGDYHVIREIARGGMGVVYLARDQSLNRAVALKSLPADVAQDPIKRERLAREAKMVAQLEHRAVATVFRLYEFEGRLFIVSEYVNGVTLRRELNDGPLAPAHLVGTLVEIAAALAAAHAHNIIHRDLKPENIVRRDDGQIKVLDFGLARTIDRPGPRRASETPTTLNLTEPGVIPGTPGYMAPEVLQGTPADARSDIFVFGLMAWELATGKHPFGSNPHSQMARLHDLTAGTELDLPGPLTLPGLDAIIRRCVRRRPEERYQSADGLLDDLRKLMVNTTPAFARVSAPPQPFWWWQFHQQMMAITVALTPVMSWLARGWVGRPIGTWMFFGVLALATTAVTLRLNLLFTSRVHVDMVSAQHRQLFVWIAGAEVVLAVMLLATAMHISAEHEATAAMMICISIVIAASLIVIEPATTRGAGLKRPQGLPPPSA